MREGELYVWRVEEDSFTVSLVSLASEVDLRCLKLNRALREKGTLRYECNKFIVLIRILAIPLHFLVDILDICCFAWDGLLLVEI